MSDKCETCGLQFCACHDRPEEWDDPEDEYHGPECCCETCIQNHPERDLNSWDPPEAEYDRPLRPGLVDETLERMQQIRPFKKREDPNP